MISLRNAARLVVVLCAVFASPWATWGQNETLNEMGVDFHSISAVRIDGAGNTIFSARRTATDPYQIYRFAVAPGTWTQVTSGTTNSALEDVNEQGDFAWRTETVLNSGSSYNYFLRSATSGAVQQLLANGLASNGVLLNSRGDAAWVQSDNFVHWYSSSDRLIRQVSIAVSGQLNHFLDNRDLVWTTIASGSAYTVVRHNPETNTTSTVAIGTYPPPYTGARALANESGDLVVTSYSPRWGQTTYCVRRGTFGICVQWQTDTYLAGYDYAAYLRTAVGQSISLFSGVQADPMTVLNGPGDVAWRSYSGSGYGIQLWNRATQTASPVHASGSSMSSLRINDSGDLAWQQSGTLMVRRSETGQVTVVPAPSIGPVTYGPPSMNEAGDVGMYGESGAVPRVYVYTVEPPNQTPAAAIGPLAAVHAGELVVLDGSGSTDPDGDALTYHWTLLSKPAGSSAVLSDPNAVMPTITADRVGDYQVQLIVNDGIVDSAAAVALVSSFNGAPVADAGPDQLITLVGATLQLDGSASYDPDNDGLTYAWTLVSAPPGSAAALDVPMAVNPGFVADVNGEYVISLAVADPFGATSTDTVTVSFNNLLPVADAGVDQALVLGNPVTLSGGGSDANGDPIGYFWSLLSVPAGSAAVLSGAESPTASFTADLAGTYVAQLIVNDGIVDGIPDTVTIEVLTVEDAAARTLLELIAYINGLPPKDVEGNKVFRHRNQREALVHKLMLALKLIERDKFRTARHFLKEDVVRKMDGCAKNGRAGRNDWIRTCDEQLPAFGLLAEAISYLEELAPNGHPRHDRRNRHDWKWWKNKHHGGRR